MSFASKSSALKSSGMNTLRPATTRVVAVDALRGLTIAFMILVNDPGDWKHVYAPLEHAKWNGWTLTDLVFPSFLFLVGCSIVFAVESRLARGVAAGTIALQMLRRALVIFAIKMALTVFPYFHMARLRIFGVLTRIALCYLIAGLIYLWVRRARWVFVSVVVLLVGYWALMRFVPVPGTGLPVRDVPLLDMDRNLAAWMDRGFNDWCQRVLHTGVLYEKTRDPEGLLSTLPAVGTTLIGVLAGMWMRRASAGVNAITRGECRSGLLEAGVACVALGKLWGVWFPINKNLWTSSYVLLAAGWSLLGLGIVYWLFDEKRLQERSREMRGVLWPWLVFGSNAITAYAMSNLIVKLLLWWKVPDGGKMVSAWGWVYEHIFARLGSTENTSVEFALAFVVVCFLPNWWLWRRKIFLR